MAASAAFGAITSAIQAYTEKAACGNDFVHTTRLSREKLTANVIHNLARDIWPDKPHPPQSGNVIWHNSFKVFCILATIGRPELIDQFRGLHIKDGRLPFRTAEDLEKELAADTSISNARDVAVRFCNEQWKFCVSEFELEDNRIFQERAILPIVRKKPINDKGGTANLFDIEVPEEFVGLKLRAKVQHLAYEVKDKNEVPRKHYHFALKVFEDSHDDVFENEKSAFIALREHVGMVMYAGYFRKAGSSRVHQVSGGLEKWSGTRNILLEYSDMDLDEYFAEMRPPLLPREILRFWQKMKGVALALHGLHELRSNNRVFYGWHADIKPANILLAEKVFKLADLGFAKIKLACGEDPKAFISGGTWTFAAPEHLCHKAEEVSQKIDIWSLACVFSVGATWIVGGHGALGDFQRVRTDAVIRCRKVPGNRLDKEGDVFHDGERVLAEVKEWHELLRQSTRRTDVLTDKILHLVDEEMLCADPGLRCDSGQLCKKLDTLLLEAEKEMQRGLVSDGIKRSLRSADAHASVLSSERSHRQAPTVSNSRDPRSLDSMNRKEKKEVRLDIPPKPTDSRFESLTLDADDQSAQALPSREPVQPERPQDGRSTTNADNIPPQTSPNSRASGVAEVPRSRGVRLSIESVRSSMTIDQLRDTQGERRMRRSRKPWEKKLPPDATLKKYFDNRDIIFLIDNADSMLPYWKRVGFVAETLLRECIGLDSDGIDLHFTMNRNHAAKIDKNSSPTIANIFRRETPLHGNGMHTDMEAALGRVFESHVSQLISRKFSQAKQKPLTLIVLTDGIWHGTRSLKVVKDKIAQFYQLVSRQIINLNTRPIGIQFISVGSNEEAKRIFEALDDDLAKEKGIPDIVDTTPEYGDAWKMLLGGHVEEYDDLKSP